jgi:RNA polymerase subunit RPABC4/transcription elongation factor Spt4
MIFIFGYHPITKTIGPVEEKTCPNCNNKRNWLLIQRTYYINLFFIPLIPTKRYRVQACPVCAFEEELSDSEFQQKSPLAKLNKEAVEGNMSDREYEEKLNKL